jgi:hypothetical protein
VVHTEVEGSKGKVPEKRMTEAWKLGIEDEDEESIGDHVFESESNWVAFCNEKRQLRSKEAKFSFRSPQPYSDELPTGRPMYSLPSKTLFKSCNAELPAVGTSRNRLSNRRVVQSMEGSWAR